jgi:hypothetical protein
MIDYRFTTNYVWIGTSKIEGQITVSGDVEALTDEWAKKNSMPPEWANLVSQHRRTELHPHCIAGREGHQAPASRCLCLTSTSASRRPRNRDYRVQR